MNNEHQNYQHRRFSTSSLWKKRLCLNADGYAIFSKAHKESNYVAAVLASVGKEQRAEKTGLTLLHGKSSREMSNAHVKGVYYIVCVYSK